jgi:hypothetical protein
VAVAVDDDGFLLAHGVSSGSVLILTACFVLLEFCVKRAIAQSRQTP